MLILDAGCGNGSETILLSLFFPRSFIIAIDISETAVKTAKHNTKTVGVKNCDFIQADFQFLPFRRNCFYSAYSCDVFGHVPSLPMAVSELSRVLKKGGKAAIYSETSGLPCRRRKIIGTLGFDPWVQLDGHISLYTFKELVHILDKNGLLLNKYYFYPDTYGIIVIYCDERLENHFPQIKRSFRYRFLYGRLIKPISSIPLIKIIFPLIHTFLIYLLMLLTQSDKGGVFMNICKVKEN